MFCKILTTWLSFIFLKVLKVEEVEKALIKELGKKIAACRKAKNFTQAELSANINMEEAALRRIELGGTNPTFKTLYRIATGLEMPLKELFDFSAS